MHHPIAALAGCALLLASVAAQAAPKLSADLGVVSDYRYRGYSLSARRPAVQGGVTATLANGAYASVWSSTIDEYGAGADGKGAQVELDYGVGRTFSAKGYALDVGLSAYTYPGGHNVNYLEIPASVSRTVGDWSGVLGVAYAPSQPALGHTDNSYGFAKLSWGGEARPVRIDLQAGYEHGAFAPGGKWDWSLGVAKAFGRVEAGLTYLGTDLGGAGGALVGSVRASF